MPFIVKNIRDHDIEIGSKKLPPGDEFSSEQLTDDINAAANKADISITVVVETAAKPKADVGAINEGAIKNISKD
jgi:hypothetical protein